MNNRTSIRATRKGAERHKHLSRRCLLKSVAAGMSAAALLPSGIIRFLDGEFASPKSQVHEPPKNPHWYGFNLLEYFSTDPDWMKYFPYKDDGMFLENDFQWIRDWGFNWVRLPMDYRFWTAPDLFTIDEKKVEPIDRTIRLGEKYNVHVNVCLHRAPGLCILDMMDEKSTGIHITKEKTSVFYDPRTLDAFVNQWTFFAKRYKGIPSKRVSFNLVNEPIVPPSASEIAELEKNGRLKTTDYFNNAMLMRHVGDYERVAKKANNAIRAIDPERLVVTDGYPGGGGIIPGLFGTEMLQSCHTYNPMQVTHHQCEWVRGGNNGTETNTSPTWPLKNAQGNVVCDRQKLASDFRPWTTLAAQGVPIHFGEMGCYKHTPPDVVLAWCDDTLDVVGGINSGFALWNFRGPFGVLDTERPGTKFEDWRGHQLDRNLLTLLRKKTKT